MVTRDTRLRRAATFGLLALTLGGATACGSSADQERLRAEELARARAEGARQARIEARSDQAAVTAKELRRELNRLRKRPARTSTGPTPTTAATTSSPAPATGAATPTASTGTSCGAGVIVNSVTSCPFGVNTRDTYYANRQPAVVDVYSTVTDRTYTMSCTSGSPHVCTGGNNARVTFP
jgi:hypothetical protein